MDCTYQILFSYPSCHLIYSRIWICNTYNPCFRIEQKEADYKKMEHEKYKRAYEKYVSNLYRICKENTEKVTGKREYDKDPADIWIAYCHQINL